MKYCLVLYDVFFRYAENVAEDGLACEETVASLLYVVGVWVVIYVVGYLVDARQGMEDAHVVEIGRASCRERV